MTLRDAVIRPRPHLRNLAAMIFFLAFDGFRNEDMDPRKGLGGTLGRDGGECRWVKVEIRLDRP